MSSSVLKTFNSDYKFLKILLSSDSFLSNNNYTEINGVFFISAEAIRLLYKYKDAIQFFIHGSDCLEIKKVFMLALINFYNNKLNLL